MTSTAVVILNYNGKKLLKKFLPSVVKFSKGEQVRIVVADNNSSDGSREFITHNFPTVELIHIPDNLGFCGGYNYALQQIITDYYILLNSDIEVTPHWITPIIDLLEKDKTIGAAQPKILSYQEKNKFEHAGAAGGFIDMLGYPFCRGRVFTILEEDNNQYDNIAPVFWVTGACLFIRASLFKKLNGFDEDFFAHMEEIDLCWSLHRLGYKVVCSGGTAVYHVGGATLPASSRMKTYYNFRNGIIILIKHMPLQQLLLRLPIRILLDWIAAIRFFIGGYRWDALAVLKAHVYLIKNSSMLRKKRTQHKIFPYRDTKLIYKRSIVLDHFLLKKKCYQDLEF